MGWGSIPDCYLSQDYGYEKDVAHSGAVDKKFRDYFEKYQDKYGSPRCGTNQAAFLSDDGWVYKVALSEFSLVHYCTTVTSNLGETSVLFSIDVPVEFLEDQTDSGSFFVVLPAAKTVSIAYGVHKQKLVHPLSEKDSIVALTQLVSEQLEGSVTSAFFDSSSFLHDFIVEELDGGQIGVDPVSGDYALFDF